MSKKSKNVAAPAAVLPIPTDTKPDQIKVTMIGIDGIAVVNKNDRTRDEAFMARVRELAASIGSVGLQQPIIVRKAKPPSDKSIVLIAGERRMLAAQMLGWIQIPAVVLEADADEDDIRAAENLQREDLDDAQKAFVIGDLVAKAEALTAAEHGCASSDDLATLAAPARDAIRKAAVAKVAERFGKPLQWVRDYAYVGGLPKRVRELGAAGRLSLAHLKALAAVVDPDTCIDLANDSSAGEDTAREPMGPLAELQERINRTLNSLAKVPWDLTIEFAGKPACQGCEFNSRNRTGLFEGRGKEMGARGDHGCMTDINFATDAESEGVCLNMPCFRVKADACKTAMRSAGNRIAGAAAEAKPKERGAVVGRLVNQANQKHNFVKPTVFRKEVQERIESKLEKPKGGTPAAGQSRQSWNAETPEQRAEREAGHKLAEAVRTRNRALFDAWTKHARTLDNTTQALLLLLFKHTPILDDLEASAKKRAGALASILKLLGVALQAGPSTALATIVGHLDPTEIDTLTDWRLTSDMDMADMLASEAGVETLPPRPVLADFLPKKPASEPAKTHPPAKTKGGKKPAGKKTARKSKASGAIAPLGPRPATVASVMDDSDDRGRSERAVPAARRREED